MTFLDTAEPPKPQVSPALFFGTASPLWAYFGAAAAGGVAFWWMTQWTRPTNLEALFASAAETLDTGLDTAEPVGGESAPVSLLVAEAEAMTLEPEPPVAAPEPESTPTLLDSAAPAVLEVAADLDTPKKRKSPPAATNDGEA